MAGPENLPALHVPARDLPIPHSVSPAARAIMAMRRPPMPGYPALDDKSAWRAYAAAINGYMLPLMRERGAYVAADTVQRDIEGVTVYEVRPQGLPAGQTGVVLDIHGGAFIVGGGECCRAEAIELAGALQAVVWSVDYSAPPDHPYPAPLDDCLTVYRHMLRQYRAQDIVVAGASAGANLAAALVLRARDEGLPLPGGAVLNTPGTDLTNSGDSHAANNGLDAVLSGDVDAIGLLYAGGHDLTDPYVSPQFGDFTKGFCPSFLSAGTRDRLLSNAVRLHAALRAADVPADLYIIEAASHGGFHGAPEEAALNREVRRFVHARFGSAA